MATNVVFLGAPGSGKGTQVLRLSDELHLPQISSGMIFREQIKKGTDLGLKAKSYLDQGRLVPDDVTNALILDRLNQPDCANGFLLDGFPRTVEQAKALDAALGWERVLTCVLYLHVDENKLLERLSGRLTCRNCQATYHPVNNPPAKPGICDRCGGELYQRADDNAETVKNRLNVFFEQTQPVYDYYHKAGRLAHIDGNQSIEWVTENLRVTFLASTVEPEYPEYDEDVQYNKAK